MPDVIIPEGYGQAVLIWSMLGKQNPMTSTIGYGAGLVPPQDAADAMYDCAVAAGSIADPNFMLSGFTFEGVRVYQETSGGLIVAEHLEPVSGVAIGTTPPVNASLLASKRTLYAGRKFRGRMYVPNAIIPEGDIDAMGILNNTQYAVWSDIPAYFLTQIDASSLVGAYVLHSDVTAPTQIVSMVARRQMATQRRRMRS